MRAPWKTFPYENLKGFSRLGVGSASAGTLRTPVTLIRCGAERKLPGDLFQVRGMSWTGNARCGKLGGKLGEAWRYL